MNGRVRMPSLLVSRLRRGPLILGRLGWHGWDSALPQRSRQPEVRWSSHAATATDFEMVPIGCHHNEDKACDAGYGHARLFANMSRA